MPVANLRRPGRRPGVLLGRCHRAGEYRIRQLNAALEKADNEIASGAAPKPDTANSPQSALTPLTAKPEWWSGEITRLETELTSLLDTPNNNASTA